MRLRTLEATFGGTNSAIQGGWTMRTRPLLAALAALPLLSGCVGEGELEPDWGAAVDALVEEVGGGLWADGGNPLADGDDDGFTCPDVKGCAEKCNGVEADSCFCAQTGDDDDSS